MGFCTSSRWTSFGFGSEYSISWKCIQFKIEWTFFLEELAYCLIQTKNPFSGEWLVILCQCKLCKEWLFIKASLAYLQLSWSDGKVAGWNSGIISCDLCNPQIDSMWENENNNNNKNKRVFLSLGSTEELCQAAIFGHTEENPLLVQVAKFIKLSGDWKYVPSSPDQSIVSNFWI